MLTSSTRLQISIAMVVLSSIYAVLVFKNPDFASAIASGYVALLLTAMAICNVRKKK